MGLSGRVPEGLRGFRGCWGCHLSLFINPGDFLMSTSFHFAVGRWFPNHLINSTLRLVDGLFDGVSCIPVQDDLHPGSRLVFENRLLLF